MAADTGSAGVRSSVMLFLSAATRVVCVSICLGAVAVLAHLVVVSSRGAQLFDFAQEWTSARNYYVGEPIYLEYGRSLEIHFGGGASANFRYCAHPPGAVLLALPFSLLTYRAAFLAWSCLSVICLLSSLWLLFSGRRLFDPGFLVAVTFVMTSSALMQQLVQGQLNLVLLLLITGAWFADRKNAPLASGVLVGTAAAIKLFPAFLVLYFVAQRKWRGVIGAVSGFLAVNGTGWLLFGMGTYRDYFLRVAPDVAKFRDTWPNASLLGYWSKLFDGGFGQVVPLWHAPALAQALTAACCVILALATIWAIFKVCRAANGETAHATDQDLAFSLCSIAMLLASPITWDHYFLLLFPACLIVWRACPRSIGTRTLIAVLAVSLIWLNPFWLWRAAIPEYFGANGQVRPVSPAHVLTLISFQFYALLGFYLLVFAELCRRRRAANPVLPAPAP